MLKLLTFVFAEIILAGGLAHGPTSQPEPEAGNVRGNWWGRAQPDPVEARLLREMTREADSEQIPDVVEATPYASGAGLIEWHVYFDRKELEKALQRAAPQGATIGEKDINGWHDRTNAKLIAATVAAHKTCGKAADLTPEIDISFDFAEGVLKNRCYCGTRNYRGTRLLDAEAYRQRVAESLPDNARDVDAICVVVEVVPKLTTIRPRESLSGMLRLRNLGTSRVSIEARAFPEVIVSSTNGQAIKVIPRRFHGCGLTWAGVPPITIPPGGTLERSFSVGTDPLGQFGGIELSEGEYVASFPDLKPAFNVPTYVKPAKFTVKAESPSDLLPRILRFGVGGNRLVVIRENGIVQLINIDDGSVVREFIATGYSVPESYENHEIVSPDGRYLALVKTGNVGNSRGGQVTIFALDRERPADSKLRLPSTGLSSEWPWQFPWLIGFDDTCKSLTIGSTEKLCRIDVASGTVANEANVRRAHPVSPDGRYYVLAEGRAEPTLFHTEDRRWNNPLKGPGKPKSYHWGRRGLYVGWSAEPGLILVDEEGERKSKIPCNGQHIVGESPDGRYLAIEESDMGILNERVDVEI